MTSIPEHYYLPCKRCHNAANRELALREKAEKKVKALEAELLDAYRKLNG